MNNLISIIERCDNMEFMAKFPDKFFDLAICDPPYGAGNNDGSKSRIFHRNKVNNWNKRPSSEYFKELFRVSKNQIIWGGNYFTNDLNESKCWILWDKIQSENLNNFSQIELAWTNFNMPCKLFRMAVAGQNKIHINQKPIELYNFCLKHFAKLGFKILDTNIGSQSSRIASYELGFDFWGCEIDEDYFQDGCDRFEKECFGIIKYENGLKVKQQKLFI